MWPEEPAHVICNLPDSGRVVLHAGLATPSTLGMGDTFPPSPQIILTAIRSVDANRRVRVP